MNSGSNMKRGTIKKKRRTPEEILANAQRKIQEKLIKLTSRKTAKAEKTVTKEKEKAAAKKP